ncbi:MAG: hypothetical protein M3Y32_07485 [Pseudomonadota bacterium]|nr:hypothetical protein [Pseudomonadota bacterium]
MTDVTADRALWSLPQVESGYSVVGDVRVSRDLGLTAVGAAPCCITSGYQNARPVLQEDTDLLMLIPSNFDVNRAAWAQTLSRGTDAGRTWRTVVVEPPADSLSRRVAGIGYRSASEAWATFFPYAYPGLPSSWQRAKSNDGGHTWDKVKPPIDGDIACGVWRLDAVGWMLAPRGSPDALWFDDGDAAVQPLRLPEDGALLTRIDRRDGHLLASFGSNALSDHWYTPADGGTHWTLIPGGQPSATQATIDHLWFFDARQGLAADSSGAFLRTEDRGRTWAPQASNPQLTWTSLQFTKDATRGGPADGSVWRLTDRGLTWLRMAGTVGQPNEVFAIDALHA